ncbi:dipeptidase [Pseudosporangium ferrugineum]|uniref:Acetylornithine deacetylase/succinyl-diaminopimelate desuccinylase-like protein n=1 Tax=Pseudosporangium ferrugineum TaxID=439699 RepID=A0A2T0SBQ8_9ACTN|nr:dipeptidase [Pseudosporangium ferrugineum]PRY30865.1 acetylornithine deacetylase/succinyl-diaminopimelate desuccinylase-like protein [Pseudosporangium ferrugineum]
MDLRERINALMGRARADLAELVAIPSVADPRQFPPEMCERAANWVRDRFAEVGFTDLRLEETADGSRAVYGARPALDPGAPTVLLYAHYDVQPPLDTEAWRTPPFTLTEVAGRWYGRGAADCKGNIVAHLTALRALGDGIPANLKLIVEGSEEQGTGGLEDFVPRNADLLRADAILVCDTGNAAVGSPAVTVSLRGMVNVVVGVEALGSELHSGMFGGAAPDALAALVRILATLRDDAGNTTIAGLDNAQTWYGEDYPAERFRADAGLLDGVSLLGDGSVPDMIWARPAISVLGIDCPPVVGSAAAIQPHARARLNLRVPPGLDPGKAYEALAGHLQAAAPWGVHVTVEQEAVGQPFRARTGGPAYTAMAAAMRDAFGRPMTALGQGGSIPLCTVFADTYPEAEIILMGVEDPLCRMHAPNESVHPGEIAGMALTEALFLQRYAGC